MATSPRSTDPAVSPKRRPFSLPGALALGALLAPCMPSVARANIRAPQVTPRAPSGALAPAAPSPAIRVLGERLTFTCDAAACDVAAEYRVTASAAANLALTFILPTPERVTARVGAATPVPVTVSASEPLHDEDVPREERMGYAGQPPPVYQARFSAPVLAGENLLAVTYRQPLGQYERDHSYFKHGRFLDFFRYELWPLAEWQRAPGFQVQGDVVIARPPPSWWQRTFHHVRSIGCRGLPTPAQHTLEQRGDQLRFHFQLSDPLPKRLWCFMGDDDLVSRP
jgi:hypothetical protein